ncbi:hypothetical protein SAMN04489832_1245 [Micromonospora cremea]|uniref:Uncharacterized protein n=1 Tax=Micromonospora cremea TaxID=709881 RepID=A0A1N5UYA5_9ACTN|nr:hypothetical protein SAMN04489832_1245 [Micromonospora cremea]
MRVVRRRGVVRRPGSSEGPGHPKARVIRRPGSSEGPGHPGGPEGLAPPLDRLRFTEVGVSPAPGYPDFSDMESIIAGPASIGAGRPSGADQPRRTDGRRPDHRAEGCGRAPRGCDQADRPGQNATRSARGRSERRQDETRPGQNVPRQNAARPERARSEHSQDETRPGQSRPGRNAGRSGRGQVGTRAGREATRVAWTGAGQPGQRFGVGARRGNRVGGFDAASPRKWGRSTGAGTGTTAEAAAATRTAGKAAGRRPGLGSTACRRCVVEVSGRRRGRSPARRSRRRPAAGGRSSSPGR